MQSVGASLAAKSNSLPEERVVVGNEQPGAQQAVGEDVPEDGHCLGAVSSLHIGHANREGRYAGVLHVAEEQYPAAGTGPRGLDYWHSLFVKLAAGLHCHRQGILWSTGGLKELVWEAVPG